MTERPSGWEWSTVGDIARLTDGPFGSNLKTSHYTEAGPRVVRLQNIGDGVFRDDRAHISASHFGQLEKHSVIPGDVVVASLGLDAPRACMVPSDLGDAIVKADCIRVRTMEGVHAAYLMWMLNSPPMRKQGASIIKGVGRPRLGLTGLRTLNVPVPPLNEQRRIVAAIEEEFSRLDAADRSLALATSRLSALRRSMLAAATGGHESVELGSVVSDLRYGTSIKCSYDGSGLAVVRIPNVRGGSIELSDLKFSTTDTDLSLYALEQGDILFVRTNGSRDLIGRVASVDGAEGMAFASYLIRARPDQSRLDPKFAVMALSTPALRAFIESKAATTAGQYNLNLASLRSLPVPLPPIHDQRVIVAEVDRRLSISGAMGAEVRRAQHRSAALHRSILERAFRGKLVRQDPADDPASLLLERIRAQRSAAPSRSTRRRVGA